MKPYNYKYVLEKIKEYNSIISCSKCDDFEIKKIDGLQGVIQGYMYSREGNLNLPIIELHGPEHIWMRLTPAEIEGSYMAITRAKGKVGVVGLGLGYTVQEMLKNKNVNEIIVYEVNKEVIDLYYRSFPKDPRVKIKNIDAFEAPKEVFDFFYVDIYEYKLTSNVAKDYEKFINLHDIMEYSFFGMEHFLLSCKYEEIVWVFIPEEWMEMSKKLYVALSEANYLDKYQQLDENLVSQVLERFKEILNNLD